MSVYYLNTSGEATEEKTEAQCVEDQSQTQSEAQTVLNQFWPKALEEIKAIRTMDLKQQVLPLARIKKIMKLDEDVKMISAEAPLLFAKAAEIFIQELTLRAWIHTEDNKRRTLQRNDIAMAISKYDQFDFLIDIVPRDDMKPAKPREEVHRTSPSANNDQVYYFQLAQQHHANLQQNAGGAGAAGAAPAEAIQIVQPQQVQTVQIENAANNAATAASGTGANGQTQVLIQTGQPIAQNQGGVQVLQQIVTPNGEIQQIPINLTPQQLNMIKMQLQGNTSQSVIIQTAPMTTNQPHLIQVAQPSSGPQQVFITQAANTNNESE